MIILRRITKIVSALLCPPPGASLAAALVLAMGLVLLHRATCRRNPG